MDYNKKYHFGNLYYKKEFLPKFANKWYEPYTNWPNVDLKVYALPEYYSFDINSVTQEVLELLSKFGTSADQNADYSGLSLTAKYDSVDPLSDWCIRRKLDNTEDKRSHRTMYLNKNLPDFVETPYEIETSAMTPLIRSIASKFKSQITKVNIVKLDAGGAIVPHVDFPYYRGIRLHASIITNTQMWYDIEGERFQIPSDGKFYFFNAGRHHGVINEGTTDRINLNINLLPNPDLLSLHGLKYMIDHEMI